MSFGQPFIKPNANAAAKLPVSGMPMFASAEKVWSAALGMVPVAFWMPCSVPSELVMSLSQLMVIICWWERYASAAKNKPIITSISFITFFMA